MSGDDPTKTIKIKLVPVTKPGNPAIVDDAYNAQVTEALQGGDKLQAYFDSRNQAADYWSWISDQLDHKENPFVDGVDPDGHPILMASNGNTQMRVGHVLRGPQSGLTAEHVAAADDPPVFGITSIETHNTTSNLSGVIVLGVDLLEIPPGVVLTKMLFKDLISPIYNNAKLAVGKLVQTFKENAEVEDPTIDPQEDSEPSLSEASDTAEDISGELAEEGAESLVVDWGMAGAEMGGLGVLAAIPLIIQFLAHPMMNSLQVINRTDEDFKLQIIDQKWGKAAVVPVGGDTPTLPKMDYNTDSWGDKTTVKVAYEANYQFINSNQFGSIGYVMSLTRAAGGPTAKLLTSVPWAGTNTIWVGESNDGPDTIYQRYATGDGVLAKGAAFGNYRCLSRSPRPRARPTTSTSTASSRTIDKV